MRYPDALGTRTPYSVIGLGTWQFGSVEWGYHRPATGIRTLNTGFLPDNLERISSLIGVLRDVGDAHDAYHPLRGLTAARSFAAGLLRKRS